MIGLPKARLSLLPWKALTLVADVLEFGADKYGDPYDWHRGYDYSQKFSSCLRHLTAWWEGEDTDPESGKSHLAHAGCNVLFLLTWQLSGRTELDDRPGRKRETTTPTFRGDV